MRSWPGSPAALRFDANHFRGADGFAKDGTLVRRKAAGFAADVAACRQDRNVTRHLYHTARAIVVDDRLHFDVCVAKRIADRVRSRRTA